MQILVLYATVLLASCANSLGPAVSCRMQDQYHVSSDQRAAGVDTRGDQAMGFSHETAAHHFALLPDGANQDREKKYAQRSVKKVPAISAG